MSVIYKENSQYIEIILHRPAKLNALDTTMLTQLLACVHQASASEKLVVKISAVGSVFCSGLDLVELVSLCDQGDLQGLEQFNYLVGRCLLALAELNKWIVLAMQGNVYGGGLGLLAISDYVVAKEGALVSFSELEWALVPGQIYPYLHAKLGASVNAWLLNAAKLHVEQPQLFNFIHGYSNCVDTSVHEYLAGLDTCQLDAYIASKNVFNTYATKVDDAWCLSVAKTFAKQSLKAYAAGRFNKFVKKTFTDVVAT